MEMQRQIYLDNLRTICMLLGVFVHAAHLGDFGAIDLAPELSNMFRMATFFLISGFLGAMLLLRQGRGRFWAGRLRNLVIPLVSALALLNLPALWLIFEHYNGDIYSGFGWAEVAGATFGSMDAEGPMIWHLHLWFLFSLIAYVLLAPAMLGPMQRAARIVAASRMIGWRGGLAAPVLCMAVVAGLVLLSGGIWKVAHKLDIAVPWLVQVTLDSLPYYALGMFLFLCPSLWSAIKRIDIPGLILLLALVALGGLSSPVTTAGWALHEVTNVVLRCWISFALIALFERWANARVPVLTPLGGAIYTIYLFHYLLIYVVAALYLSVLPLSPTAYLAISCGVIVAGFAVHLAVQHSAVLTLLFNGRVLRKEGQISRSSA